MEQRDDRLPLPSEDSGDLVSEPREGMTDDPTVATEEGVPYDPPNDPVLSESRGTEGPDVAGTDPTAAGELEREDGIQGDDGAPPRDDELAADVVEALRSSDVTVGDRIRVRAEGSRVWLSGKVESVDILDEILGIVGDVVGVGEVADEVTVTRAVKSGTFSAQPLVPCIDMHRSRMIMRLCRMTMHRTGPCGAAASRRR